MNENTNTHIKCLTISPVRDIFVEVNLLQVQFDRLNIKRMSVFKYATRANGTSLLPHG